MADEIRADYPQLRQVAAQFANHANAVRQVQQRIQRSSHHLQAAWTGRGSQAFFAEMTTEILPAVQRLINALYRAQAVTLQIGQIFQAAEEDAARPFQTRDATPGALNSATGSSPWRPFIDLAKDAIEAADLIKDVVPIPAAILLAFGLQAGTTYPGQVLVRAPQLLRDLGISGRMLRDWAGVSEHLAHIKAANIATHIGKMTKTMIVVDVLISAGKGVIAVADVWDRHAAEYAGYDLSRNIAARTVDAGLALLPVGTEFVGGTAGVLVGAKIGMAVGTVGGPVGMVAGGLVGAAIGGFAGDWVGGKTGEGAVNLLEEQIGRNQMIDFVDDAIVRPVTDTVRSAVETVGSWFVPTPALQLGGGTR